MIKKTMKYTDFDGIERVEEFRFHFTPAELVEMEASTPGGLSAMINRIVNSKDIQSIISVFKELLLKAYGVKSPDGRRFMKSKELSEEFSQTQAYSDLYMELAFDPDKAADFINGIIPEEYKNQTKQIPNA